MGVLIGSAVIPITLCMFWARLTGVAMMAGALGGTFIGVVSWLSVAAIKYDGGLYNFMENTGIDKKNICDFIYYLIQNSN